MPVPAFDPCVGPIAFLCDLTSNAAGSAQAAASDYVLGGLAHAFVAGAAQVGELALTALDATTSIDLSASWFRANVAVIAAITLPVLVGLFVVQVIGSVLRREPGGLGRAVLGVGKALVGAALALAVTQLALTAVDGICSFIATSAGTTVAAAASKFFDFARIATSVSPGLQIVLGMLMIAGFLLLWGLLVFRKAALLLVAVFAPVAFAGQAWDATRVWTRRWLEVVAALVLCKVVIVVVFVLGASAFSGTGPSATGSAVGTTSPAFTDLLVGLLLLSIALFAPWVTWRFVHWGGMEAATAMTSAVAASIPPQCTKRHVTHGANSAIERSSSPTSRSVKAGDVVPTAEPVADGPVPENAEAPSTKTTTMTTLQSTSAATTSSHRRVQTRVASHA